MFTSANKPCTSPHCRFSRWWSIRLCRRPDVEVTELSLTHVGHHLIDVTQLLLQSQGTLICSYDKGYWLCWSTPFARTRPDFMTRTTVLSIRFSRPPDVGHPLQPDMLNGRMYMAITAPFILWSLSSLWLRLLSKLTSQCSPHCIVPFVLRNANWAFALIVVPILHVVTSPVPIKRCRAGRDSVLNSSGDVTCSWRTHCDST